MKLTLRKNPKVVSEQRPGSKDTWFAEIEGFVTGVGKTRAEAVDALVRGNLGRFGITEWFDSDPESPTPDCEWKASPNSGTDTSRVDDILREANK